MGSSTMSASGKCDSMDETQLEVLAMLLGSMLVYGATIAAVIIILIGGIFMLIALIDPQMVVNIIVPGIVWRQFAGICFVAGMILGFIRAFGILKRMGWIGKSNTG